MASTPPLQVPRPQLLVAAALLAHTLIMIRHQRHLIFNCCRHVQVAPLASIPRSAPVPAVAVLRGCIRAAWARQTASTAPLAITNRAVQGRPHVVGVLRAFMPLRQEAYQFQIVLAAQQGPIQH
jgi:hypothetical protein